MAAKSYRGARYVPGGPHGYLTESPIGNGTGVRVTSTDHWFKQRPSKTNVVTKRATKFKAGSKLHRTQLSPEQIANRMKFGY